MNCKKKPSCLYFLFLLFCMSVSFFAIAQKQIYSVANAHSHNDYEQQIPFWMAWRAGFGSVETDIFLVDGLLYVAHDSSELHKRMKLETAYLKPLSDCIKNNNGYPYADRKKKLQILIDIKSDSIQTLKALIALLRKFPSLTESKSVNWVITGNRPDPKLFTRYPRFISFDGEINKDYQKDALSRISLLSDNFKHYCVWTGRGDLPENDVSVLKSAVSKAHRLQKPVRFWNAPDEANAWNSLMLLQVDYINTDHIDSLAIFLNSRGKP